MRDLAALLDLPCSILTRLSLSCSFGSSGCSNLQLASYDFGGLHLTSASDAGAAIISTANPPEQSCSSRIHTYSRHFDYFRLSGCMTARCEWNPLFWNTYLVNKNNSPCDNTLHRCFYKGRSALDPLEDLGIIIGDRVEKFTASL